jgi:hypothetical protein
MQLSRGIFSISDGQQHQVHFDTQIRSSDRCIGEEIQAYVWIITMCEDPSDL